MTQVLIRETAVGPTFCSQALAQVTFSIARSDPATILGQSSRMPDEARLELRDVYAAVAARRTGFDNMLWQVPVLSFTAQAFLFSIALAPDSSRAARILTSLLAMLISFLSIHLLTRHRQAEIADGEWLGRVELLFASVPERIPSDAEGPRVPLQWPMHGPAWRTYRNGISPDAGRAWNWLGYRGGYAIWSKGMALFGIASLVVAALSLFAPDVLADSTAPAPTKHEHHHKK